MIVGIWLVGARDSIVVETLLGTYLGNIIVDSIWIDYDTEGWRLVYDYLVLDVKVGCWYMIS